MKFIFLFLGKTRETYIDAGIRDYADRLARFVPIELVVIKEKHARKDPDESIRLQGAKLLLERCRSASLKVALDPIGRQPDSEELASILTSWELHGRRSIYFLIGGHLGLHKSVLDNVDLILSLSKLTFTHEMTRLILLEQLYRACTINAGHKYHK